MALRLFFLVAGLSFHVCVFSQPHEPREPLRTGPLTVVEGREQRLVVKFRGEVLARTTPDGSVVSRAGTDLEPLQRVVGRLGLRFSPLIQLSEAELARLEARAAERSGRAQPDLAGILCVELEGATPDRLVDAGFALQGLDLVEFTHIESLGPPPPCDIPPITDDLTPLQGYRQPDPGLDVDHAWSVDARGQGVRFTDCEYDWHLFHEDFCEVEVTMEEGHSPYIPQPEHGTAALGIVAAGVNGFGCTGMAPEADFFVYPEWTWQEPRRADLRGALEGLDAVPLLSRGDANGDGIVDIADFLFVLEF